MIEVTGKVESWSKLHGKPYFFFYYYIPTRYGMLTSESNSKRTLIWNFKNGKNQEEIVKLLEEKIKSAFKDTNLLTLVCVPASTSISNNIRFRDFSHQVCNSLNMQNAFSHIAITKEKEPAHRGGSGCSTFAFNHLFFEGKKIVLFDDVVTRGSSMRNFTQLLENNGAEVICYMSIGRTYYDAFMGTDISHPWSGHDAFISKNKFNNQNINAQLKNNDISFIQYDNVGSKINENNISIKCCSDNISIASEEIRDVIINQSNGNVEPCASVEQIIHKPVLSKHTIRERDTHKGLVKRIVDYGAFIDLGGFDGLLHISNMSNYKISHPSELLTEGQIIDVKILSIDDKKRISLAIPGVERNKSASSFDDINEGDICTGTVKRIVDYGAFINIGECDGLLHISNICKRKISHPSDVLTEGEIVHVKVISIDKTKKRVSLERYENNLIVGNNKNETLNRNLLLNSESSIGNIIVGDVIEFGKYDTKNIEWIVLDKNENNILLISRYVLECMPYHNILEHTTWENCSLRSWLNNDFLHTAFSPVEQSMILQREVLASSNPVHGTNNGKSTNDKVFLISIVEFNKYFDMYNPWVCSFENKLKRQCWSRTLGSDSKHAAFFGRSGSIHAGGSLVNSSRNAVRPVFWVQL